MKDVQCYELFGGIALKIHTFSFFHFHYLMLFTCIMLFLPLIFANAFCFHSLIIKIIIMVIFKRYFSGELISLS